MGGDVYRRGGRVSGPAAVSVMAVIVAIGAVVISVSLVADELREIKHVLRDVRDRMKSEETETE